MTIEMERVLERLGAVAKLADIAPRERQFFVGRVETLLSLFDCRHCGEPTTLATAPLCARCHAAPTCIAVHPQLGVCGDPLIHDEDDRENTVCHSCAHLRDVKEREARGLEQETRELRADHDRDLRKDEAARNIPFTVCR